MNGRMISTNRRSACYPSNCQVNLERSSTSSTLDCWRCLTQSIKTYQDCNRCCTEDLDLSCLRVQIHRCLFSLNMTFCIILHHFGGCIFGHNTGCLRIAALPADEHWWPKGSHLGNGRLRRCESQGALSRICCRCHGLFW